MTARDLAVAVLTVTVLSACGGGGSDAAGDEADGRPTLAISAIPDQEPAELKAREEALADYLSAALDVEAEYVPVTDYTASVNLFRAGDLDMVFYGGLTGVQARLQTEGAELLAQRDVDASFRTVFIAGADTGIEPIDDVAGLTAYEGSRFTFGSESSTSGRLMPEYFLREAGLDTSTDFAGDAGFSGSHDTTIDLVEAGSYEGGALNQQVWQARKEAGTVDLDKVVEVFTSPPYADYHWIGGPELDERFGEGFTDDLREALLDLDGSTEEEKQVLEAYGAEAIVATEAGNYDRIEAVARELRLLS
jgi:phosphonate transport system substrate-binding protein